MKKSERELRQAKLAKRFAIKLHMAIKYNGIKKAEVRDLQIDITYSEMDVRNALKELTHNPEVEYITYFIYEKNKQAVPLMHGRINAGCIQDFRKRLEKARAKI